MWIRTQDKQMLIKVSCIWIYYVMDFQIWKLKGTEDVNKKSVSLGTFTTESDAINEINAIEQWIETGGLGVYQIS